MPEMCEKCGANLALVGRVHNCNPKPRGGVGRSDTLSRTGSRGPVDTLVRDRSAGGAKERLPVGPDAGNEAPSPRGYKPKVGPPRIEDRGKTLTATQPWKALGMSRASWYKRHRAKKAKK